MVRRSDAVRTLGLLAGGVGADRHALHDRAGVDGDLAGGLNRFERKTERFIHYENDPSDPQSLSFNAIQSLFVDQEGTLWIGTNGGGLDRLDPDTGIIERFAAEFGGNQVRSLLIDRTGLLWAGTGRNGVATLDPASGDLRRFLHEPGNHHSISSNRIETIFEDSEARIWIGTDAGLNLYDGAGGTLGEADVLLVGTPAGVETRN